MKWPHSTLFWTLAAAGVLSVLLLVLCSGFTVMFAVPTHPTTVAEVEKKVRAEVPLGSTREKVEKWLDSQEMEHSFAEKWWIGGLPPDMRAGLNEDDFAGAVCSIIRDTDRDFFVHGDICVYFLLGHDGKCAKICVFWVGTGP